MALDWLPTYPTPTHRPRAHGLSVSVQNVSPIPNAAPPTELTWLPHYPDALRRPRRVLAPPFQFRWPMVPVSDLRWAPSYPSQLHRPSLGAARMPSVFTVLGVQQAIASGMRWTPTYPDRMRPLVRVPASQRVYPIQGTTILTAVPCIEWNDETATRPELTPEVFTRPQMTCQSGGGYLLLEDGGHFLLEDGGKILLEDQSGIPCESFVRPTFITEDWC